MDASNSGLAHGTSGSPQTTIGNKEAEQKSAENEARIKAELEAKRKAEEEARIKAELEAKEKAEEEARIKAELEAKRKAEEAKKKAEEEAEKKAKREHFLRYELVKSSPLKIPENADIKDQIKTGYEQVKYIWKKGKFKYTLRWHTRTPNAPKEQGITWVVERKRMGTSTTRSFEYILVGKKGKNYKWVSMAEWKNACTAWQNKTATKEQEELLKNGHWKV